MGSRRRAQSPSSVNKTSQWRLACVFRHAHSAPRCGYKRRARANAHQLFASEPSHCKSPECSQDESHGRALVLRRVNGGRCPVLLFFAVTLLPPLGASALLNESFSTKRANLKELHERRASFYRWLPARAFLDVVGSWLHLMVTIAAPRAWALGTLRQRSWMSHVLTVGTWPWRCCAPDTSSLDVGVSPLLCPVLVPPDGGLLRLRARVNWGSQWELPRRVRGPRTGRGPASHSVPQQMTGFRSLHRGMS